MTSIIVIPHSKQLLKVRYSLKLLCNIHLLCTFPETLTHILIHNNSSDSLEMGGEYRVLFKVCNDIYFKDKSLQFRIDQHKGYVCWYNNSNTILKHINNHIINWNNKKFIFIFDKKS